MEKCLENEKNISLLKKEYNIVYIPGDGSVKLGHLRNIGNRNCKGDITVCMDDDDYYPPTRVEHAVSMLTKSKRLIAGCSAKYLYDYCLQRLIKFDEFSPSHSTNDCMAWKKEYLDNHAHDPNKSNAEEASFTNNFTEPMVQLEPKQTIISSSHYENTFNKKEIVVYTCIGIYPKAKVVDISENFNLQFEKYCSVFKNTTVSPFDIIYHCGGTSIEWDPEDKKLGGSEQAVVHLSTEWVKLGKKVAVYGKVPNKCLDGVEYFDWKTFNYGTSYNTVILWRNSGINAVLQFPIKTKQLFADFHDNTYYFRFDYHNYVHKIDRFFFKSEYHVSCYNKKYPVENEKVVILPNGIRVSDFSVNKYNVTREKYRFCYCSCYTRGLREILEHIWPIIYRNEPLAELHIYYGMDGIQDTNTKRTITMFMGQPGIMDHGRMPMDFIIREKWKSTFHMYITDTDAEIDCISIRESLCAGCIPLISKFGVFENRDGIHYHFDKTPENYKKIAESIIALMRNDLLIEKCREKMLSSPTIKTWEEIAKNWLK